MTTRTAPQVLQTGKSLMGHMTGVSKTRQVPIAYTVYPETDKTVDDRKTPLICSHGLFGLRRDIGAVAEHLSKQGRKVVAYDFRNHGDSGRSPDHDVESMADDLDGLLNDLNFQQPLVMGHSVSSKAAMWQALNRPNTMRALIVLDAVAGKSPGIDAALGLTTLLKSIAIPKGVPLVQATEAVGNQLKVAIPNPALVAFILTTLKQYDNGKIKWSTNLDAVVKDMDKLFDFPAYTGKPFDKPTLFVYGGKSEHYEAADLKRIKELFPNSSVKSVPGAGHFVNKENPTAVAKLVNEFCESLELKK